MLSLKGFAKSILPPVIQTAIRRHLYYRSLSKFHPGIVRHEIFGEELSIWLGDPTAKSWYDRDIGKLPFIRFMEERFLVDNSLVLYVGGHYCVYANAIAKMLKNRGRVVAAEANPDIYEAAKKNIELNNLENIEVIHQAISDSGGSLKFSLGQRVSRNESGKPEIEIPAGTIDELSTAKGTPRLVVVDVEGYECISLKGAKQTLQKPTDWCIEVHTGCGLEEFGGSLAKVTEFFPSDRFELFMAKDYGMGSVAPLDLGDPLTKSRFHLIAISMVSPT